MAQVFSTTNASVPAPVMSGGYYPGIDRPTIDGRGLVQPWGGGPLSRQFQVPVDIGQEPTPETNLQQLMTMMVQALPGGNTINYNFEGLIGPAGGPGPAGPTSFVFARDVEGNVLNAPTRVLSDGAVPGTVANVSATALIQAVMLEWDANTELDIDHYIVYRHTSDASGSSSAILTTYATLCVDGNRTGGTQYFYWVKAVDYEGNTSASYSTSVNATPTNVETGDIVTLNADKVLISGTTYLSNWRHSSDVTKIDGGDIYASSITLTSAASDFALASIGGDADDIGDGTTNKMYTATEQTKLTGIATGADVTGSNTANDTSNVNGLAASSVSGWAHGSDTTKIDGGDIYTGTVTATQITANTITASEIAATTITYAELRQTGGSEAVDTGCMRDDATLISNSASTDGSLALSGSWLELESVAITSEGNPVTIVGNAKIHFGAGGGSARLGLFVGATQIADSPEFTDSGIGDRYSFVACTYTPGSGAKTFYLKGYESTGITSASLRKLSVEETKGK